MLSYTDLAATFTEPKTRRTSEELYFKPVSLIRSHESESTELSRKTTNVSSSVVFTKSGRSQLGKKKGLSILERRQIKKQNLVAGLKSD